MVSIAHDFNARVTIILWSYCSIVVMLFYCGHTVQGWRLLVLNSDPPSTVVSQTLFKQYSQVMRVEDSEIMLYGLQIEQSCSQRESNIKAVK